MTYTTKYKVGDEIWAMIRNRPVKTVVEGLEVYQSMIDEGKLPDPRVTYAVRSGENSIGAHPFANVPEDLTADTKEDLLAKL